MPVKKKKEEEEEAHTCFVSVTGTHLKMRSDVSPTVTHFFSLQMDAMRRKQDRKLISDKKDDLARMRATAPLDMTWRRLVGQNRRVRTQTAVKVSVSPQWSPWSLYLSTHTSIERLNRRRCSHRGRHIHGSIPLAPPPTTGNRTLIGRRARPSSELFQSEMKLSTAAAAAR